MPKQNTHPCHTPLGSLLLWLMYALENGTHRKATLKNLIYGYHNKCLQGMPERSSCLPSLVCNALQQAEQPYDSHSTQRQNNLKRKATEDSVHEGICGDDMCFCKRQEIIFLKQKLNLSTQQIKDNFYLQRDQVEPVSNVTIAAETCSRKISYGEEADFYIFRGLHDTAVIRHAILKQCFQTHICNENVITNRVQIAQQATPSVKNIRVVLTYETKNEDAIWPELNQKVASFRTQPWMAQTLFSVFGNIYYRKQEYTLECTAIRNLKHVRAISKTVRDDNLYGTFSKLCLHNYNVMRTLSRYVQVTPGGAMERVFAFFFGQSAEIVPRTEEMPGVMYVVIKRVCVFIKEASEKILFSPSQQQLEQNMQFLCLDGCRLNLHITHSGNVTLNFAWQQQAPSILESEIEECQKRIQFMCDYIIEVLLQVS